ncbi:hypothetical protein IF188_09685 [Microbacterium sp. NEAU-LLC]|uniref:Uncharacterized protein n=1 Tax=Microbacterium helvum TaxID=2773713 RepID=A0ABR8NMS7_9MICO|nr:hypothetical protein [Microbacterium helvum]MBD3941965.1 hypothetical protein [Microbacterium helvum]
MTGVDVDRLALSHELASLAERFAIEATLWREPSAREECERTARHLAELSRLAIWSSSNIETLTAYADAARLLAGHIEGTRRFFKIILTPPNINRK